MEEKARYPGTKDVQEIVCIQAHVIQLLDDVLHNMINYRGLTGLVCAINDQ